VLPASTHREQLKNEHLPLSGIYLSHNIAMNNNILTPRKILTLFDRKLESTLVTGQLSLYRTKSLHRWHYIAEDKTKVTVYVSMHVCRQFNATTLLFANLSKS
jgi:hypothetical protein